MAREPITEIDVEQCTGCGTCVEICPSDTLSLVDGKAWVTGKNSIQCGQCAAVCPSAAVSLSGIAEPVFSTIASGSKAEALLHVMRHRRSVRAYTEDTVDIALLEDLVKAGITAPSGTNSQQWTFTILPTRPAVEALAEQVARFYEKINRMAENPVLCFFSSLSKKDALAIYRKRHYERVKEALDDWRKNGRDRLFHGATAGIVIAVQQGASCGPEDALLAAQNILLVSHAMGLGTCLIGFAVEAMKRDLAIQKSIGIPKDESVYAVIAIGRPAVSYPRPAGRKQPIIRYFRG